MDMQTAHEYARHDSKGLSRQGDFNTHARALN